MGRCIVSLDHVSLLRISDFSKLSRVSVKMLRHYDDLGLLKPARVDAETDYRYYSVSQLPRLNRLIALKDLGFSLEQLAHLLDGEVSAEQMHGMLILRRAEIEQQLRSEQARLVGVEARLRQIEQEGHLPVYDIVTRRIEPQRAASIRTRVDSTNDTTHLFEEVEHYVARHQARAASPPLTIYYDADYREHDAEVEVAIPVSTPLQGNERIHIRELPAIPLAACVIHAGSYHSLDQAWQALFAWIEEHGYRVAGPSREVYLRFGAEGLDLALPLSYLAEKSDEYVTELQLPIE
jgi:effector-binding domain-containing protein